MIPWIVVGFTVGLTLSLSSSAFGSPPTSFTSLPQSGTPEVLGSTKVLVCGANGVPDPSYRWIKDGRPVRGSSSNGTALRIRNIQRSDAGRYQCIAANSHGSLLSTSAQVHVAYMRPFPNRGNSDQYVNLGHGVVIDLPPIDCYPAPSVEWLDSNGLPVSREAATFHVTLKNQLVILEAKLNLDGKTFKATATNIYTQQKTSSQLFIIRTQSSASDVTPRIVVPPSDATVVAGTDDATRFECVVNARPLSYVSIRWFHHDPLSGRLQAIETGSGKYMMSPLGRVLTILNPTPSDAGTYQCEGSFQKPNQPGQTVTATAVLSVHVKPSFVTPAVPEIQTEVESDLVLDCEVRGEPVPSVQWYHNSELVNPSSQPLRYSILTNGSLVITNASVGHSGVYQCFASNNAGDINSVTFVNITSFLPVMSSSPYNLTAISGDAVTFPCSASGAPRPTVAWARVSATAASREPVGVSAVTRNDLVFSNVEVTDTGAYTCSATNTKGTVHLDVYLHVAIRTRIVTPSQDFSVHRGSGVSLPCSVVYDPHIPVSWYWSFNGMTLDMTDVRRRQRMPDGSLHIRSSDGSDIGDYVCQVVSIGGNDSVAARLNVVELPHQPMISSVRLSSRSETSAELKWLPPAFNGNSEIRKFIVYFRIVLPGASDEESWQMAGHVDGKDSTDYTIHQLQPSQSFQFCVSAVNEVGEGRHSVPSSVLAIPQQAPSGPPRGVFGSPRSESSIILQWQPPEKSLRNGRLLGYQISYKLAGYPDSTLRFENMTDPAKNLTELSLLEPFHEYDIAVAAYNAKGIGVFSDYIRVRTKEGRPVAPPVEVEVMPLNSTAVSVSWTPPHQRHINGLNQGYRVVATPVDGDSDAMEVTHVVMSNTSNMFGRQNSILTSLGKFTKYAVTVSCFTSAGDGPKCRPVAVKTHEDVPNQVESMTFGNRFDTRLEIFWKPPRKANGILTGYLVRCREMNQTDWMLSVELSPSSNNYTITGLVAHTSYYVDVSARTQAGVGASHLVIIESGIAPEKPGTPFVSAIKQVGPTSVQLEVSPNFAESHLSITRWIVEAERRHQPVDADQWRQFPVASNFTASLLSAMDLQPDVEYRFRVSVGNSAGWSNSSEPTEWIRTGASLPTSPPDRVILQVLNASAILVIWTPLSESYWNGRGRHYTVRYWACEEKNVEKESMKTLNEESVTMVIGSLEEWTLYCFQATACNDLGCSEYNGETSAQTMESVPSLGPTGVEAETVNSTAILVSWSAIPEVHQNGKILGYKVLYRPTLGSLDFSTVVVEKSKKSVLLTGLQKFSWYKVTVVAFTRVGDGAASFPVATTQTLEDVPGALSCVHFPMVNDSSARIAWLPPSQPNGIVTGYRVIYGKKSSDSSELSVLDESLGRDRFDYSVSNLDGNSTYMFVVSARTRVGWGDLIKVEAFLTTNRKVPPRPNRPFVDPSQIGDRWVMLTLMPEVNSRAPVRNYTVQVRADDGQFLTVAVLLPSENSEHNISGLTPATSYSLRLVASNDVGMSEFSEASDVFQTRSTPPDHPPDDVSVSQKSATSVEVKWMPPRDDSSWNGQKIGYRVYYRQLSEHDSSDERDSADENSYQSVTTPYPKTSVSIGNLVPKVVFEIRVAAINSVGHGPMSLPVDILLSEAAPSIAPENLRATAVGPTSIHVSWKRIPKMEDNLSSHLGYEVFYWVVGHKTNTSRVKVLSLAENYTVVETLRMFTQYAFVIGAFGAGGRGPNSSPTIKVWTQDGVPGPPEELKVLVASPSSIILSWESPTEPNGVIQGYELTYFQETLIEGERKSVHVLLSGDKTSYHARDLRSEGSYSFRLRAKTRHGLGPEVSQSVTIGNQPGSPEAPQQPECTESDSGVVVTWSWSESGSLPVVSFIVQYRLFSLDPDSGDWVSLALVNQSPDGATLESKVTVPVQDLVEGATYQFRVFAVNSHGISQPSTATDYVFDNRGFSFTQSAVTSAPFYQRWWFLVAVAVSGLIIVLAIVASLCVTGRRRAKRAFKADNSRKKRISDVKPPQSQFLSIDDETGFATIERRHPQLPWATQKYPKATTLPLYTKAPPRPSPGSILYDTELTSQHEDSGNVSDKASNNEDSDGETETQMTAAFLDGGSRRPHSLYGTHPPDEAPYTISLNGGHSIMPKYHTMRPPKLSSFV